MLIKNNIILQPYIFQVCPLYIHNILNQQVVKKEKKGKGMTWDWGQAAVATVLFVILSPGMVFQLPAKKGIIKTGNFETSVASLLVHTLVYFFLGAFFFLFVGVHMYLGKPPKIEGWWWSIYLFWFCPSSSSWLHFLAIILFICWSPYAMHFLILDMP